MTTVTRMHRNFLLPVNATPPTARYRFDDFSFASATRRFQFSHTYAEDHRQLSTFCNYVMLQLLPSQHE